MASTLSFARQVAQIALRQQRSQLQANGQLVRSYATEHTAAESGGIKQMLYITLFCVPALAVVASNSANLYGNLHGTPRTKNDN